MLLVLAYASDYSRWRFPFIAIGLFFTFCGFVIYASINVQHDLQVAYFACCMMTWELRLLLCSWTRGTVTTLQTKIAEYS